MNKMKYFWCELFGDHDWVDQETFHRDGTLWIVMMCSKCGKVRIEPAPIQEIPHIEISHFEVVSND